MVLNIAGMHCASCALDIDGELEDTKGVVCSSTSYAKQKTEIEFDSQKISEKEVVDIIKRLGYKANSQIT